GARAPTPATGPPGGTRLMDTLAARGTYAVFHAQVWYRVATSVEPTSYSWSVSGSSWTDVGVLDYANVNAATPIDASAGVDAGSTARPRTPPVNTTQARDAIVAAFIHLSGAAWTAGS